MEAITLEKVDLVRARTGVGYASAYEALQASEGDVVRAIVHLEEMRHGTAPGLKERLEAYGDDLAVRVRRLVRAGNDTRIVVRHGDRTVLEMPATVGAVGAALAPAAAALGVATVLATRSTIHVERRPEDGA